MHPTLFVLDTGFRRYDELKTDLDSNAICHAASRQNA
jgi:hypothetical protein